MSLCFKHFHTRSQKIDGMLHDHKCVEKSKAWKEDMGMEVEACLNTVVRRGFTKKEASESRPQRYLGEATPRQRELQAQRLEYAWHVWGAMWLKWSERGWGQALQGLVEQRHQVRIREGQLTGVYSLIHRPLKRLWLSGGVRREVIGQWWEEK